MCKKDLSSVVKQAPTFKLTEYSYEKNCCQLYDHIFYH